MTEELQRMLESYVQVEGVGIGSGSIVKHGPRSTYVLTCQHVVVGEKVVMVVFREGGRFRRLPARIIAVDADNDLALVRTSTRVPHRQPIELAADEPELYTRGYVMGSGAGLYGTAGEVVLCSKDGSNAAQGERKRCYQFTGVMVQGMSGGLLCDFDARLVGVPHLVEREETRTLGTIGFAVPLPVIKAFLEEHIP